MIAKAVAWAFLSLILLTAGAAPAHAETPSIYKFSKDHVAPLVALQEVAKLIDPKNGPVIAEPELEIFKLVAAGHPERCDVKDTMLVASGITDPKQRLKYAAKIDAIAKSAGEAIADSTTPEEKAKALAKYLFDHQFQGGYNDHQLNMAQLLDKGTFNCVSSANLYSVVGQQLGIKTVAQEAPKHVFLQMGDLCIEPTGGFAQSTKLHQDALDELWADRESDDILLFSDKHYHTTNRMGLIGEIYFNRAIQAKKEDERTVYSLKACCLCPTNPLFANSAGVKLHNWVVVSVDRKDIARAKKIIKIAGELFGDTVSKRFFKIITTNSN